MCGRFTLHAPAEEVMAAMDVPDRPPYRPLYNIAPSVQVLTVGVKPDGRTRGWAVFKWGLVPKWANDVKSGPANARAETVATLPTFREAFSKRRCLVVADGFYEWKAEGKTKQPYHFKLKTGKPFAFAGLWDFWKLDAQTVATCCILTTTPNAVVGEVHNRMPVILDPADYGHWLDRSLTDPEQVKPMLATFPAELMEATAVSRYVSNARNEGPECLEPAA